MHNVEVLLISNKYDFTTDYVCYELEKRGAKYLRINRDCFAQYKIIFCLVDLSIFIEIDNLKYLVTPNILKSIYFRAPVFIREFLNTPVSLEDQLYKSQWNSFIRNLSVFENAIWINNPVATYKAENKILQLKYAEDLKFKIPFTYVANTIPDGIVDDEEYAVKALDTAHFKKDECEYFVYTNIMAGKNIKKSNLAIAPVIIQENIDVKIDLRVTVIGSVVHAVSITYNGVGLKGDWRKQKFKALFTPINLPNIIEQKCINLTKNLGLVFAAIDLAICNDQYYFIEINPTGEWAWLVDAVNQKTYIDIVDNLIC